MTTAPTAAMPKPPTPTHDEELTAAVRQLAASSIRVESRLEAIEQLTLRSTRVRSLAVAFGVFVALVAFRLVGWIVVEFLGAMLPL